MIPALFAGLSAAVAAAKALPGLARAIKSVFSPTRPSLEVSPSESDKYVVFTYDRLGQLVGVNLNQTPTESFTFDPSGNLTGLTTGNTTTSFSYNSLNQQTAPAGQVFDAKGQTTTTNGRTYEWDDQGRITAIVMGTQRTELAYDGMSRRTKITEYTNGTMTSKKLYFWLGGSIVCERDGLQTGFPITKRFFTEGLVQGTTKLYYCTDHLGSVRELVDSTGAVRAEYRYSTYGEQTKQSGDLESDFGYAGLWNHKPSGLYLGLFRAYDPVVKRWISRDPLGEGADRTLYSYAFNSPVNFVDPNGLDGLPFGYRYGQGGLEQIPGYDWDADSVRAADSADFMLFLLLEGAMQGIMNKAGSGGSGATEEVVEEGAAATTGKCPARLPQDVKVNPKPPAPLRLNRPIGKSPTQNARAQADIQAARAQGATDIRVNQQQVNANGVRVGTNRPDVQYTLNGNRVYHEYDTPSSGRGPGHQARILSNDPGGTVHLHEVR